MIIVIGNKKPIVLHLIISLLLKNKQQSRNPRRCKPAGVFACVSVVFFVLRSLKKIFSNLLTNH